MWKLTRIDRKWWNIQMQCNAQVLLLLIANSLCEYRAITFQFRTAIAVCISKMTTAVVMRHHVISYTHFPVQKNEMFHSEWWHDETWDIRGSNIELGNYTFQIIPSCNLSIPLSHANAYFEKNTMARTSTFNVTISKWNNIVNLQFCDRQTEISSIKLSIDHPVCFEYKRNDWYRSL